MMNKTYQPLHPVTVKASANIKAFRFVAHNGAQCQLGVKSLGVSESDWNSGEYASVYTLGTVAVEVGGAIILGSNLSSDAEGRAKIAGPSEQINGRALESCPSGVGFIKVQLSA